jgi:hypothetical protein
MLRLSVEESQHVTCERRSTSVKLMYEKNFDSEVLNSLGLINILIFSPSHSVFVSPMKIRDVGHSET